MASSSVGFNRLIAESQSENFVDNAILPNLVGKLQGSFSYLGGKKGEGK